ncbi:MAG: signal peptide peptidase SppA [Candidatus Cloacimonetes bacterium]|nr:signal peptide peptidase SppA [Candidatus Cloacimonadota bacterium]
MQKKWVIIAIVAFVVFVGIMFVSVGIVFSAFRHSGSDIQEESWLYLDISGSIVEYKRYKDDIFSGVTQASVYDIEQCLRHAAADERIAGVVLSPRLGAISGVGLTRIGSAIEFFKTSGKPVEAWLSSGSQKDYWLATYADRIHMIPTNSASLLFTGVGGGSLFYTDALAKLGIKVHVFQVGDSKGAGEMFERTSFSAAFRRNLSRLLDGYYESMLQALADRRFDGDTTPVRRIYEERESLFITPAQALDWGLVDALLYGGEFLEELGITEEQLVDWDDYDPKLEIAWGDQVAVIYAQGGITSSSGLWGGNVITSADIDEILDEIEDDQSVKAVVLRVDSPGGSAFVSERIFQRLKRMQQSKPLVVSMAGIAASGGYYISCGADSIFAEPFTITGSIGVVSMLPNLSGLADDISLHSDTVSRGKFSDVFNVWRPLEAKLASSLRTHGELVYEEFKTRVADGRDMTLTEVQELAQGKLYTGRQAVDAGLVDAIGGLDDALDCAARLAGITQYRVESYPRRVSMFEEMLREGLKLQDRMQMAQARSLPADLDLWLHMLSEEHVLMLAPVASDVHWDARTDIWALQKLLD